MKRAAIFLLVVLMLQLFTFLAVVPVSRLSFAASDGTTQTLLWLTNDPSHPTVNGISSYGIMNTSQKFSFAATEVENTNLLKQNWYLYPLLAGSYTMSGDISLGIWINATGASPKGTPSVTIYERSPNGTQSQVPGTGSSQGSKQLFNVPHYLNLSIAAPQYTFQKGSSIVLDFSIQCGSSTTCEIWYGSSQYDSRLSLPSVSGIQISSIATYNANLSRTGVFADSWSSNQRKVIVLANITDPFGSYDIRQTNASITMQATNSQVFFGPMNIITSGAPTDFSETFEAIWSYPSTASGGNYTILVSTVDNSGYLYKVYFGSPNYGPYLVQGSAYFSIGVSVPLTIKVSDSHGLPLGSARVAVVSGQVTYAGGTTNSSGFWSGLVFNSSSYQVLVRWEGTIVANQSILVTKSSTVDLNALVYYPSFKVTDSSGTPLGGAEVFFTFPNGTHTDLPIYSSAGSGIITMPKSQGGGWGVAVYWQNQNVTSRIINVNSDGPFVVVTRVYSVPVAIEDASGSPLNNAYVVAYSSNGLMGFGATNTSGSTLFRLPAGNYNLSVFWDSRAVGSYNVSVNSTQPLSFKANVYYLTVRIVSNTNSSIKGADIVIYEGSTIRSFDTSNSNGSATFLLPIGTYTVLAKYTGNYWLSEIKTNASAQVPLTSSRSIQITLQGYPPSITSTNGFYLIIGIVVAAAVIGFVFYRLSKRK